MFSSAAPASATCDVEAEDGVTSGMDRKVSLRPSGMGVVARLHEDNKLAGVVAPVAVSMKLDSSGTEDEIVDSVTAVTTATAGLAGAAGGAAKAARGTTRLAPACGTEGTA